MRDKQGRKKKCKTTKQRVMNFVVTQGLGGKQVNTQCNELCQNNLIRRLVIQQDRQTYKLTKYTDKT